MSCGTFLARERSSTPSRPRDLFRGSLLRALGCESSLLCGLRLSRSPAARICVVCKKLTSSEVALIKIPGHALLRQLGEREMAAVYPRRYARADAALLDSLS